MPDPTPEPTLTRNIRDLGPLHQLLLRAAPTAEEAGMAGKNPQRQSNPNRRSITTLAAVLGLRTWTIYLWIKLGKVPPHWAKKIVDQSDGRVTLDEFHPFVYS